MTIKEPYYEDAMDPRRPGACVPLTSPNLLKGQPLGGGMKYDKDKSRMDLLDAEWMESVGDILGFGARKYAAHNWRGGIEYSRLIAAAYRHLGAFNRGEDIDAESGLHHIAHASCCLMFLYWMHQHRADLDDRWKDKNADKPEAV